MNNRNYCIVAIVLWCLAGAFISSAADIQKENLQNYLIAVGQASQGQPLLSIGTSESRQLGTQKDFFEIMRNMLRSDGVILLIGDSIKSSDIEERKSFNNFFSMPIRKENVTLADLLERLCETMAKDSNAKVYITVPLEALGGFGVLTQHPRSLMLTADYERRPDLIKIARALGINSEIDDPQDAWKQLFISINGTPPEMITIYPISNLILIQTNPEAMRKFGQMVTPFLPSNNY